MTARATDWKPLWAADCLRLLVDLALWGVALLPAGAAFVGLWSTGSVLLRVLAFPAAFGGLFVGYVLGIFAAALLLLRRMEPGIYSLTSREARRWLVADSFMRMYHRNPLHHLIDDFAPLRYIFYRLAGAKIDRSFFFGWNVKILDPWGIEVGRNCIIGSFAVLSCHSVKGDTLILNRVTIGDRATIGMRSVVMPGVHIGDGAVIGTGALVTKGKSVPDGAVWVGVPAAPQASQGKKSVAATDVGPED